MSGVVVDTSAMVAVVQQEPGHDWLVQQLQDATTRQIAAPVALELGIVLEARAGSAAAAGISRQLLHDAQIQVVPFDEQLAERALEAWRAYGKGRHPAALNFGDCCTFALAAEHGQPILCAGDDFARTDHPVLRPPAG